MKTVVCQMYEKEPNFLIQIIKELPTPGWGYLTFIGIGVCNPRNNFFTWLQNIRKDR